MFSPRRLSFMPTVCCGPSWSSWPGGQEPSQTAPPLLRPQDFESVERNSERMGVEFDPHGFCHVLSQDGEYHGIPRKFMKIPCEWWLLLQSVRFCKIQFCAPALCPLWGCLACGTPRSSRSLCFSTGNPIDPLVFWLVVSNWYLAYVHLVGGFKHLLFSIISIIYGIILHIDFHIFQDGYCTTNQINQI